MVVKLLLYCLWTGVPPELIDAVSSDPETGNYRDDHQPDPDVGEKADTQLDEETAEGDDNGGLQQSGEQTASWFHTASRSLLRLLPSLRRSGFAAVLHLGTVARHRVAGDNDIAVDLVAPDVPAGLPPTGKQFQIWPV